MSVVANAHRPLRALYAERPQSAMTSKWARTSSDAVAATDPFHGEVEIGRGYGTSLRFGIDRHIGGLHDQPNPGDLLCAALAACADGTVRMIANLLGVVLEHLEVEVSGQLDVRGALAIDPEVPVGFRELRCNIAFRAAPGTEAGLLDSLVNAAERYCVNFQTLRAGVAIKATAAQRADWEPAGTPSG